MRFQRLLAAVMICAAVFVSTLQATSAAPPDEAHPYSEPIWWPLRNPVRIECHLTNCPGPYHGYEALDLVGSFRDPIYPAGAGVLHIGSTDRTCLADKVTPGTYVWVDHGAAGRTFYSHLDSIEVADGAYVTPDTMIGRMGSTGQQLPCETNYLHFERRLTASPTTRLQVGNLLACQSGETLTFPDELGHTDWDDFPSLFVPWTDRISSPFTDDSCLPQSWAETPDQPSAALERGVTQLEITPSARSNDVDNVRIRVEQWHPSLDRFGSEVDQTISPSQTSAVFTDLTAGTTYRARVAFQNDAGWSEWSDSVEGIPGVLPTPPLFRNIDSSLSTLGYAWFRAPNLDAEYDVAIRRAAGSSWGPWVYDEVIAPAVFHRFRDLDRGTTYQVTVRARNEFGTSDWAPFQSITTLGCEVDCDSTPEVFSPLEPARFADTRDKSTFDGQYVNTGPRQGDTTWEIAIAGRNGVPETASAALLNLTALNASTFGYATVTPCDGPATTSSVNFAPGTVEPNEVIAKLSDSGTVCIFTSAAADLIVDVVGHVTDSPYQPLTPQRFADSRDRPTFDGNFGNTGLLAGGETWEIPISGRGQVPESAATVTMNVTVTGGAGPGYLTVFPCGDKPLASSLNFDTGVTRPNELIAKLSKDGTVCVFTSADVNVIVDVVGYANDVVGYTPLAPVRLADSRDKDTFDGEFRDTGRRAAGSTWEIQMNDRADIRDADVVIANVTVTGALAPGYVTIFQCGERPNASSLNYVVGTTRPNETVVKLSDDGAICVFTSAPAHIIVDVVGFTNS